MPPTGDGSGSCHRMVLDPSGDPRGHGDGTGSPNPAPGSGKSCGGSTSISQSVGVSASSATPAATPSSEQHVDIGSGSMAQGLGTDADPVVVGVEDDDVVVVGRKRQKKCTSNVWKYFTKETKLVELNGVKHEQLWGVCSFPNCKSTYRAESYKGTTGFWGHLRTAHSVMKGQQQLRVGKENERAINVIEPYRYDEETSIRKFHLAIVMHEYPFNIVEHEYLVDFIKSLHPSFPIRSRVTVRKELMDIYLKEKEKLYELFKTVSSRFSATMDMWTSNQNKSYMGVTVHWIDDEWRIQKRIVNFFHVKGRHTGEKLHLSFTECMVRWYIENKLFSLTLDNASANEVAVNDIIDDLNQNAHASLVCDGIFFHVRCACHILNLVAKDGFRVISKAVENIRSLVLAVKSSPLQWEELMKRASECGLDSSRGLSIDVSTRWNSTFLMLRDALYYKAAFIRLKTADRRRYEHISPSPNEWNKAVTLFQALKKFYDLTELLSGTSYPTANLFFRGFCEIKALLADWCTSIDPTISNMAAAMSLKFEKYWSKSNVALAVGSFLDPRYKKKLVEFYMRKFHGDGYQAHVDEFVSIVKKMYHFYASSAPSSSNTATGPSNIVDPLLDTEDDELESYLYDSNGPDHRDGFNELEKYMADPLLKISGHFDILAWWKYQVDDYPVLSQIARDVLAIQVSTVASESAFSAGGRVIDAYRSRHDPEMVQALICTKDWVAAARRDYKSIPSIVGDLNILEVAAKLMVEEEEEVPSDPDEMNDAPEL